MSTRTTRTEYSRVKDAETKLVSCKYFTTSLFDLDKPCAKDLSKLDSFCGRDVRRRRRQPC